MGEARVYTIKGCWWKLDKYRNRNCPAANINFQTCFCMDMDKEVSPEEGFEKFPPYCPRVTVQEFINLQ